MTFLIGQCPICKSHDTIVQMTYGGSWNNFHCSVCRKDWKRIVHIQKMCREREIPTSFIRVTAYRNIWTDSSLKHSSFVRVLHHPDITPILFRINQAFGEARQLAFGDSPLLADVNSKVEGDLITVFTSNFEAKELIDWESELHKSLVNGGLNGFRKAEIFRVDSPLSEEKIDRILRLAIIRLESRVFANQVFKRLEKIAVTA